MGIVEPRALARRLAIEQTVRTLALNRTTQSRTICSLTPPIRAARVRERPLVDRRQRQKPPGLGAVLGLTREPPKLQTASKSDPERDRHGEPPSFTKLNHTHPSPQNHERVRPSGTWYKRLVSNFIARGKSLIQNRFRAGPLRRMRAV